MPTNAIICVARGSISNVFSSPLAFACFFACLVVFSTGCQTFTWVNFTSLGAELFSRLNNFVFAPRMPLSSSEMSGHCRGLLLSFAGGAGCGLGRAGGSRQRLSVHLFLGFASPLTQVSSCQPCANSGNCSASSCTCPVGPSNAPMGSRLQTRDPLPSARCRRLSCLCARPCEFSLPSVPSVRRPWLCLGLRPPLWPAAP